MTVRRTLERVAGAFGLRRPEPDDGYLTSPPRLIDIPGQEREPSADLLRRLRVLEPYADVLYVGGGHWLLGRVKPVDTSRGSSGRMGRRWAETIRFGDGFYAACEFESREALEADRRERFRMLQHALLRAQGFVILKDVAIVRAEVDAILEHELRRLRYFETNGVSEDSEEEAAAEAERASQQRQRRLWEREMVHRLYSRSEHGRGNPAPVTVPALWSPEGGHHVSTGQAGTPGLAGVA